MKKVLMINKFYYVRGGAEKYMFDLSEELKKMNFEIIPFSMKDPKNVSNNYEQFFVDNVSYDEGIRFHEKVLNGLKSIYSIEAKRKISKLLDIEKIDIAHIHNYNYQLTPSILGELKKRNIPVVQTLHDPQIICPHHRLYDFNRNSICEDCKGHKYYNAVKNKCVKSSYIASTLGAIESTLYNYLKTYEKNIDLFISPSEFLKKKVVEFGVDSNRVQVIPNFVDLDYWEYSDLNDEYVLFIGRLSEEKGIQMLLEAMKSVKRLKVKIVGTGPLEEEVKSFVQQHQLTNVEVLGYKAGEELKALLSNSLATIIPSQWYENCPISILESYACGKPVIGTNLGGIPDMVENHITGLLFEPNSIDSLVDSLNYVYENQESIAKMGHQARQLIEHKYHKNIHLEKILQVYNEVQTNENSYIRN